MPLASMISSDMLEAKQGFATLEDVDQGTMTRFIEWLYRGYYHAAAPKLVAKPEKQSENSDSQKIQEGSGTSSGFNFGVAERNFSGVDATEALRGVFSTPATSQAPPSLFGTTVTNTTADSLRGFFGDTPPPATATAGRPRGPWTFGSAGALQVTQSSVNANAPATSARAERAARMPVENSTPISQGRFTFGTRNEAPNTPSESAIPEDTEKRNSKAQTSKELFIRRKYNVRQKVKHLPLSRLRKFPVPKYPQEDFSEVFFCHVYLYIFADKYDIQTLKVLALEELHATLASLALEQECTGDVLKLLRYVYREAPEQANKMEDLRTLMAQYMESEFETLVKDESLGMYLSEDNGELLEDFLKILRKRLAGTSDTAK